MKSIERIVKIGLASLSAVLVVMFMVLGGIAATNGTAANSISGLFGSYTSQKVAQTATDAQATNTQPATTTTTAPQQQSGVLDARYAVKQTGPAVVTVVNTMQVQSGRGRFGGQSQTAEALGSGVIFDAQGYIITNQHVVANQQSLQVIFSDGTQVPATLVGQDAFSDIAVIKVDAKVPAVAQFGNSDQLEVGQPVVAIGTALGNYENTVTEGIVSGIHRQLGDGGTSTQDMIQTDAAINHGNSGGPLLDLNGNVIGINTAVVRTGESAGDIAEGLGFAIPSNTARTVAAQLMQNGTISHPYIGITYEIITPQIASDNNLSRQQGLLVTDVAAGSPADQAGIVANSIITRFDGVDLASATGSTMSQLLSKHAVGDSVKMSVIAPGSTAEKEVTIVLANRPAGQ